MSLCCNFSKDKEGAGGNSSQNLRLIVEKLVLSAWVRNGARVVNSIRKIPGKKVRAYINISNGEILHRNNPAPLSRESYEEIHPNFGTPGKTGDTFRVYKTNLAMSFQVTWPVFYPRLRLQYPGNRAKDIFALISSHISCSSASGKKEETKSGLPKVKHRDIVTVSKWQTHDISVCDCLGPLILKGPCQFVPFGPHTHQEESSYPPSKIESQALFDANISS